MKVFVESFSVHPKNTFSFKLFAKVVCKRKGQEIKIVEGEYLLKAKSSYSCTLGEFALSKKIIGDVL